MENTQKLRTIILEDDLVAKVLLEHFCENHPYLTFINTFDNVDDAAAYLETNGTDLIFLDIMLKDSVGFDLLNKQTDNKTKIVVTTSNPAFFKEAERFGIRHFLLKPITLEAFLFTVKKITEEENTD